MNNPRSHFSFVTPGKAASYLGLYRKDAALISFVTFLVGSETAHTIDLNDVIAAAVVTLVSVNFIYSFNSWTDAHIDKLSRPSRPIPSGRIMRSHALVYSLGFLLISLVYPFFLFQSPLPILLCLLLPVLGLLYSAKPARMRDRPYASIIVICLGLIIPMLIGYFSNHGSLSGSLVFLVAELYCLAVVPLKKIEETDEDRLEGIVNLYDVWGRTLFFYSFFMLVITLGLICFIPLPAGGTLFSAVLIVSTILVIGIFHIFDMNLKRMYTCIISVAIVESIIYVLYITFIAG